MKILYCIYILTKSIQSFFNYYNSFLILLKFLFKILSDIYVKNSCLIKLGGLYFCEKLQKKDDIIISSFRVLYFNCLDQNLSMKYDIWCIGWGIESFIIDFL